MTNEVRYETIALRHRAWRPDGHGEAHEVVPEACALRSQIARKQLSTLQRPWD